MNSRRLRGFTAIAAVFAMLAFAGSAATKTSSSLPDLTTASGLNAYLTSLGVDPTTVVRQVGPLNYAGPSSGCPGVGWNCTEATTVVQTTTANGNNSSNVNCNANPQTTPPTTDTNPCVIVQMAPSSGNNQATCHERETTPTATEVCDITQTNITGANKATIYEEIAQADGGSATQDGRQYARVAQVNQSGDNHAVITQSTNQSLTGATAQLQDGHTVAVVEQGGTGQTGNNYAQVNQDQHQREAASGVASASQDQNTSPLPVGDPHFVDCNSGANSGGVFVDNPNICANITQAGTGASNSVYLDQSTHQQQRTDATSGHQTQGSATGGLDGAVVQPSANSTLHGSPTENQDQRAPNGVQPPAFVQEQFDPNVCCATSGGTVNLDQSSDQSATTSNAPLTETAPAVPNPKAIQHALLFGHAQGTSVDVKHSVSQNNEPNFTIECPPHGPQPVGDAPTQMGLCVLLTSCTDGFCQELEPCSGGQAFNPATNACECPPGTEFDSETQMCVPIITLSVGLRPRGAT
jgi:hypothetical protein